MNKLKKNTTKTREYLRRKSKEFLSIGAVF